MSRQQFKTWWLIPAAVLAAAYFKRSIMQYGLTNRTNLYDMVDDVVACLGGGENAKKLLLETAAAETGLGEAVDTSWWTGIGLMQFDKIGFDDVKLRTSAHVRQKVRECFGIDISRAEHTDLRWSPLLSLVFARLKYRLVPTPIPSTLQGRANYWKKWYNSELGKGTPEHYIDSSIKYRVA